MPQVNYTTASFTGPEGRLLTAYVGEEGATFAKLTAFPGSASPRIDATGGRMYARDSVANHYYASGIAPADGETARLVFDTLTDVGGVGVGVRANASGGYFARIINGVGEIIRLTGGSSTVARLDLEQGGSTAALAIPVANGNTLQFSATGTGSSVRLEARLNGTLVMSAVDASADRRTTPASVGLYFGSVATTETTSHHYDSLSGFANVESSSVLFSFLTPVDGQVAPRAGTTGTVSAEVAYSNGTPSAVQARLVRDGTQTPLTGFDWATRDSAPANGRSIISFANVPQGGWYNIQVRNAAEPGTVTTSGKVGVGAHFATAGQSNVMRWFSTGDGTLTPNPLLRVHGNVGPWVVPKSASMNGAIAFGNAMIDALGCPVVLLDYAQDGSGLTVTSNGYRWVPTTGASYSQFRNGVNGAGGKIEGFVWIQYSGDALQNVTEQAYYDGLTTLFAQVRSDFAAPDLPVVLCLGGRRTNGTLTDAQVEPIRRAQVRKTLDANVYRIDHADLPLSGDGVHHTAAGFTTLGLRAANALLFAKGLRANYRGPSMTTVRKTSATVLDVTLQQRGGTDYTPSTDITGYRVFADDGTTELTYSAARVSPTVTRITLAEAASGLPIVRHMWGADQNIAGLTKDNSEMQMPLEYESGIQAVDATGGTPNPDPQPDITAPVMGAVTVSSPTKNGATLTWPAATDNVGVVGYEYSVNGGTSYSNLGAGRTLLLTDLPSGTAIPARVRAYDAAGNKSAPASADFTTLSEQLPIRTVSLTLRDESGPLANLSGVEVSFYAASGPATAGAPLYQSSSEATDGSGNLVFSFNSNAIAAGGQGLVAILASDGRNFLGLVGVT